MPQPDDIRRVGIKDVAREADVAVSTVSHVLNGTASISTEVRARVLEAARRLGYLAKRKAKGTIASLKTVYLAVPSSSLPLNDVNLFSWNVLNVLTRECERRGIRIVPHGTDGPLVGDDIIVGVRREQADGVILFHEDNPDVISTVHLAGIPLVLLNGEDPSMTVDSVIPANRYAARMATAALLERGHRRILHLTWQGRSTIRLRADGFRDAFAERGLPPDMAELCLAEGYEPEHGERAIGAWLARHDGPGDITAIFAAADNLAIGALRALRTAGIAVPDEVALVGFDGVALGDLTTPPLSTVRVPLDQLALNALDALETRLTVGDALAPRRIELGCLLVVRGSGGA